MSFNSFNKIKKIVTNKKIPHQFPIPWSDMALSSFSSSEAIQSGSKSEKLFLWKMQHRDEREEKCNNSFSLTF